MFAAPMMQELSAPFAIVAVLLGGYSLAGYILWKRSSRYDLGALRRLEESGGPTPEDDLDEIAPDAAVVCPHCGDPYASWMLICPRCKR